MRLLRSAGARPNSNPLNSAAAVVKSSTRASGATLNETGFSCKRMNARITRVPPWAKHKPNTPPSTASNPLSVITWRMSRSRPAPKALRIENSRCRAAARASRRLATLAQAIASTTPTTAVRMRSGWRNCCRRRVQPVLPGCNSSFRSTIARSISPVHFDCLVEANSARYR